MNDTTCFYCDAGLNSTTAWYGRLNQWETGFCCIDCKPAPTVEVEDQEDLFYMS